MLSIGTHIGRATLGADFGESAKKNTPFVKVAFVVTQGPEKGARASWDGYFTENARERTVDSLRYCGCTFPDGDITNLVGIDANEVELVVEHEDYEDKNGALKTVARVAWVNQLGGGGMSDEVRMSDQKKAKFAAQMRGMLVRQGTGKAPEPAPRGGYDGGRGAPSGSKRHDDIPF